jgi:ABC-type multidrug transport system fused ATPase/permease subunit
MRESELSANVTFTYGTANRWLGIRFDIVIFCISFSASAFSVLMRDMFSPGLLIFTLVIVTDVNQNFSIALRYFAEMQNYLTSAQRMLSYTQLETEDLLIKPTDPKAWPSKGNLQFNNVTMRYR